MPIYRYRCECGHEFQKLHCMDREFGDVTLKSYVTCPKCNDMPERLIGKPAAHFKCDHFTKGAKNE